MPLPTNRTAGSVIQSADINAIAAAVNDVLPVAAPTGVAATDTAAIQAAISGLPASGGTIRLQQGSYALNASLDLSGKSGITLQGDGRETTVLAYTGTGDALDAMPTSGVVRRLALRDIKLVGSGGARYGLFTGLSSETTVDRCWITGFQAALRYDGIGPAADTFVHSISDTYLQANVDGVSVNYGSAFTLTNCYISNNSGKGIVVDQCRSLTVLGGAIESSAVGIDTGVTDGTCLGVAVVGTHFENNTVAAIRLGGAGTNNTQGAFLSPGLVSSAASPGSRCIILDRAQGTVIAGGYLVSAASEVAPLGHMHITANASNTAVLPVQHSATGNHVLLDDAGTNTLKLYDGMLSAPGRIASGGLDVTSTSPVGSNVGAVRMRDAATPDKFLFGGFDAASDAGYLQAIHSGVALKNLRLQPSGGDVILGEGIALNGSVNADKQTISGSRGGNAALASLLTALAVNGFITDSTSA